MYERRKEREGVKRSKKGERRFVYEMNRNEIASD
jgi:hypothetical protein